MLKNPKSFDTPLDFKAINVKRFYEKLFPIDLVFARTYRKKFSMYPI